MEIFGKRRLTSGTELITDMRVDDRYLSKFDWSTPMEVETSYGLRTRIHAKVTSLEREQFLAQEPKFKALAVTMKFYQNEWWFLRWGMAQETLDEHQRKSLNQSNALSSDIYVPAPAGKSYLPFQLAGIDYALSRPATLIADEQGLGKTVQAIGFINAFNQRAGKRAIHRILIVCPADLRLNWVRELRAWLTDKYSIETAEGGIFPKSDIVIVSFQSLKRYEKNLEFYWCLVVIDEAQYVSNPGSQMTKTLYGYRPKRDEAKAGVPMTSGVPAKLKIALTGTPIQNRPKNIFTTINYLHPAAWPSRSKFVQEFCGGYVGGSFTEDGATNIPKLGKLLRATVMVRRKKSEVLKDLPPKRRSVFVLPIQPAELAKVGQLANSLEMKMWMNDIIIAKSKLEIAKCLGGAAYLKAVSDMDSVMNRGAAASTQLLHAIGVAKVKSAVEVLKVAVEASVKVLILTHHHDVTDKLMEAFPKALRIDGAVSLTKREENVIRFQSDIEAGPVIMSIPCAKGHTLTASSTVYFVEGSWLPGHIAQAEDRAHRIGQQDSVNVTHLVMEGSIDIVRAKMVIEKQKVIDEILDPVKKGETAAEPIIPMDGMTLTMDQIEIGSRAGHNLDDLRARLQQFSDATAESMDRPDRQMRDDLLAMKWTDRLGVLAKALIDRWSGQTRVAPPPARVVPVAGQPKAAPLDRAQQALLSI